MPLSTAPSNCIGREIMRSRNRRVIHHRAIHLGPDEEETMMGRRLRVEGGDIVNFIPWARGAINTARCAATSHDYANTAASPDEILREGPRPRMRRGSKSPKGEFCRCPPLRGPSPFMLGLAHIAHVSRRRADRDCLPSR
ncbi:unnamed protein product [Nesidiocoris tenuis]|uniref:Uncharacterized protein n=2 Tax=Nesidiocoris tenuis TaxID=355587 RepID=A0A6H5GL03_9HEMI|nr:Hypothetical protein NTJ_07505 [Nesidiocoris tenuis]CAB0002269.1 unnamed protein product [Nesidiocoris tenuis]